jgi:hypothetical protein
MNGLIALLFLFGRPFWETKRPEQWTDSQVESIRQYSPWTQIVGPSPKLLVWFATAPPIEDAEAEARLRKRNPLAEPDPDYLDYLRDNRDQVFVLAIEYPTLAGLRTVGLTKATQQKATTQEKALEEESSMLIGRRTYKILGHFPPTPGDPVLRLVFPRAVKPNDRDVVFFLFLPGLNFRSAKPSSKLKT